MSKRDMVTAMLLGQQWQRAKGELAAYLEMRAQLVLASDDQADHNSQTRLEELAQRFATEVERRGWNR